ncbi:FtsX-like permease family protein [Halosimplex amylolyticum]|uniref:FtsX-like permease family protein n=1 Tax=Halosimplex amylolyticum TaxID=3396616 RepID=UPI003F565EDF
MSYRRVLVTRWSRRDRLAVLVVATITALVVGSTLVVLTAGGATTQLAGDLGPNGSVATYDSPGAARAAAGADETVLPVADALLNGRPVTVVGLPEEAAGTAGLQLSAPEPGTIRGPGPTGVGSRNQTVALAGDRRNVTVDVQTGTNGRVVPPWWYLGTERTVEQLGPSRAFVLRTERGSTAAIDDSSVGTVPLTSALAFFATGTSQLVDGLVAVTAGAALLVLVVVFSVTRMSVRDRLSTIAVLRATGLPRHRLGLLFAARAGLLTVVAVVTGAAAGVVFTNAAVNAAVFAGVPTTLSFQVTAEIARVLLPLLGVVAATGVVAGAIAILPTLRQSPAAIERSAGPSRRATDDGGLSQVGPQLLAGTAVVPTAATLTVFVAVALLTATLVGVVAPLQSPGESTVVQEGTSHPWVSRVDADYAGVLRAEGIPASGEILLFSVVDGDPFLTRGARFEAFATISDATLAAGRAPSGPGEAVIGHDLARTLGISVGDTLPLGGSDAPSFATVRVVGRYHAPGLLDDQLVVPLRTARHLSNVGPGDVNVVRLDGASDRGAASNTSRTPSATATAAGPSNERESDERDVVVTDLAAPRSVASNETISVVVAVENRGNRTVTTERTATLGSETQTVDIELEPGEQKTISVSFRTPPPGNYTVRAGTQTATLTVQDGPALRLSRLPERGPPNATLLVGVTDADGQQVPNASVRVRGSPDGNSDRIGSAGRTPVRLPAMGTATLVATAPGYRNATGTIVVNETAERLPVARLAVTPDRVEILDRPEATLTLSNPWNRTITRQVTVGATTRTVTLAPGERTRMSAALSREGAGRHVVRATVAGHVLASAVYTVDGDDRFVSALATSGELETTDSGLGQAASYALGNLRVLVATLLGLTALATVATTTAAFARVVHARRETIGIYRATGAAPRRIVGRVLGDAARIAVPASLLALVAGYVGTYHLARTGVLTAFGIALTPSLSPLALVGVLLATVGLALAGAGAATVVLVRVPPARLFDPRRRPARNGGDDDD